MPVSLRSGYFCGRFRLRSEIGVFLFCFCVLVTVTRAQTTPSREYIHLDARVIAIEVPLPTVAVPMFSPAGGAYSAPLTVTISTATAGATIRYTLDGTAPTETNGTVGTLVGIGGSKTLKAIAYKSGMADSLITSASYTIAPEVISLPPSSPRSDIIGTTVTYTTDGATDSCGNPVSYLFDWGDGTNSGWLPSGSVSASHAWSHTGVMPVKALARSLMNPSVAPALPWEVPMRRSSAAGLAASKVSR